MASKLDDAVKALTDKVTATVGVLASADAFIEGVPALIQKAKDDATAAGATDEQLKSLTDLGDSLTAGASKVSAAIKANATA